MQGSPRPRPFGAHQCGGAAKRRMIGDLRQVGRAARPPVGIFVGGAGHVGRQAAGRPGRRAGRRPAGRACGPGTGARRPARSGGSSAASASAPRVSTPLCCRRSISAALSVAAVAGVGGRAVFVDETVGTAPLDVLAPPPRGQHRQVVRRQAGQRHLRVSLARLEAVLVLLEHQDPVGQHVGPGHRLAEPLRDEAEVLADDHARDARCESSASALTRSPNG